MNKTQKIIWTFYLISIFVSILVYGSGVSGEGIVIGVLFFGWVPFLFAHFIWRDQNKNNQNQIDRRLKLANFIKKPVIRLILSILYLIFVLIITLIFVRLFITADPYVSWNITFTISPYLGAIIMGYIASKKGANWKWILWYAFLGLMVTEKLALISAIAFYHLLGKDFPKKINKIKDQY